MYGGNNNNTSNHNRNESVARRRLSVTYNKSPLSPGKLRPSANISNSTDALEFLNKRKRRKLIVQFTIVFIFLSIILYLLKSLYNENTLQSKIKERKLRLDGIGESWVLPHRYEEESVTNTNILEELEECKRVMLFKFTE